MMRRAVIACLVVALAALLWWQWQLPDTPLTPDVGNTAAGASPAPQTSGTQEQAPDSTSQRTQVGTKEEAPTTNPEQWSIHFEGIDTTVPWTAPVQVIFEGRFDTTVKVDADGIARFVPPPAARNPGNQHLRLITQEPNYRLAKAHDRTDHLQASGAMSFQVYPVAVLRGRVLDANDQPTTARVRAYPWRDNGPSEPIVAFTMTSADGTYALQVPPDAPLVLIADVEAAADNQWPSFAAPLERYTASSSLQSLPTQAQNPAEPTVLPAFLRATGTFGIPKDVADLKLGKAAALTGTVKSRDGKPLRFATVTARPTWTKADAWHGHMHWSTTHGSVAGAQATTDHNGAFTLQLTAGVPFEVHASSRQPALLAGEPKTTTSAPGHIDLVAPGDWLNIQVENSGTPTFAWLDIGNQTLRVRQAGGLPVLLPPAAVRVRARFGHQASDWLEIASGTRPSLVTLELSSRKLPMVSITANNAPDVREARCHWQTLPAGLAWTAPVIRADANRPFVTHVPPGRYALTVRDVDDSLGGGYLIANTVEVEVTPEGLTTAVDLKLGGGITVAVTDGNGTRQSGTFRLIDAQGKDVTPGAITGPSVTRRQGPVGQLRAESASQLATVFEPGRYTLLVDIPGHGRIEHDVEVVAGRRQFVALQVR